MMKRIAHFLIWMSRIRYCRGFGIQSPSDYWIVCYVINEHWPYYQYKHLGKDDDWLTKKLGRLYLRVSNWRQPKTIESNAYQTYFSAGCLTAQYGDSTELIYLKLEEGSRHDRLTNIYNKVTDDTVLIVEGISNDRELWKEIIANERSRITFDLYYCGIVLFDHKRQKHNYIINF